MRPNIDGGQAMTLNPTENCTDCHAFHGKGDGHGPKGPT